MKKYKFEVKLRDLKKPIQPKGIYYQGVNHIVMVGDVETGSTTRWKMPLDAVEEVKITPESETKAHEDLVRVKAQAISQISGLIQVIEYNEGSVCIDDGVLESAKAFINTLKHGNDEN